MNAKITVLDSVRCRIEPAEAIGALRLHLSYDDSYWRSGRFCKIKTERKRSLVSKAGVFYLGLYERAVAYLESRGISVSTVFSGRFPTISPKIIPPEIKGITFREDQQKFILDAITKKRGVISSPTGSGKTIIIAAIVSCFPKSNIVIISHTTTIVEQTLRELKGFGLSDVGSIYSGKNKSQAKPRIVVTTNQSFVNMKDTYHKYDVAIMDECHIGFSKDDTNNCKILMNMIAPYKFGVTATVPRDKASSLILEGVIGPIIGHLSLQEAKELEIIAEPFVQLVKVPLCYGIEKEKTYSRIYSIAIVHNRARNRLISQFAKEAIDSNLSVLIITAGIIHHGQNIKSMMKELYDLDIPYVFGEVKPTERADIASLLNSKDIKCVIANKVWREGTNIPNLDVVINAAAEKADNATLQRIGRALRRTKDKTEAIIIDFLDTGRYISDHAIDRIGTYIDHGFKFL